MRCLQSERMRARRKARQREVRFYLLHTLVIITGVSYAVYSLFSR